MVDAVHLTEPMRLVQMSLELDAVGAVVLQAADRLLAAGGSQLGALLDALDVAPDGSAAATALWERVSSPETLRGLLDREPVDFLSVDRLLGRLRMAAVEMLLDALAASESRSTRRALLGRLAGLGPAVGPAVVARLGDARWYVVRNLLGILDEVSPWPAAFSPHHFATHADARVRRVALKLQLKVPELREAALCRAVEDPDEQVVHTALVAARAHCPPAAVPFIVRRLADGTLQQEPRRLAIRALGASRLPPALETLLQLCAGGRTLFGEATLAAKSADVLAALAALAAGWRADARAAAVLALAAKSRDRDLQVAAAAPSPGRESQ